MSTFVQVLRIIVNYILASLVCRFIVFAIGSTLVAVFGEVFAIVALIVIQLMVLFHPKVRRVLALCGEFIVYGIMKIVTLFTSNKQTYSGAAYAR